MKKFIVNSDVPPEQMDTIAWVRGVSGLLESAKIENVKFRTAYCCTPERKMIAEFEGPDKETVSSALSKIDLPFTLVMEATKVDSTTK
jgi:hypothetical protein